MATVQCDTVSVTVDHPEMGAVLFSLPAYTVPADVFGERVTRLLRAYLNGSARKGQPISLADFTLFLIGQSAADPTEQEA